MCSILDTSRSQWPCSLRRVFMTAHLLGLWVWILLGYGCLSFVGVVCGLAEVSATGWSLIQRNPTEFGVSDCDHEASTMKRPWPTRGCHAMEKTLDTSSPSRAAVSWIPFCNVNLTIKRGHWTHFTFLRHCEILWFLVRTWDQTLKMLLLMRGWTTGVWQDPLSVWWIIYSCSSKVQHHCDIQISSAFSLLCVLYY